MDGIEVTIRPIVQFYAGQEDLRCEMGPFLYSIIPIPARG